jgi:hypothetical protein
MPRSDQIKSVLAGIMGGVIATRPDIEEIVTRVLMAALAMLATYLLTELLERANYNEIGDRARREARRRGLPSRYEWDPKSTRDYRKERDS